MASWLFGSTLTPLQQYDELLQEATSELLPTPALNGAPSPDTLDKCLRMSDMVRSGQVKAADAVRGLRRRIAHTNPNVQLLTLLTLDVAIKNSGDAFLREVASSSISNVAYITTSTDVSLVDSIGNMARSTSNHDVRVTTLRLLQNWATAFESRPNLAISPLVLLYRRLRVEGADFPPKDPSATAAMIDSMAAPEWKESDVCSRCRDAFSLTNRRHHCRNCGEIFDQKCSAKTMALPHFGITQEVRVCDGCYKKLRSGRRASLDMPRSPRPSVPSRSSSVRSPSASLQPRSPSTRASQREEDDLQLALRLSLADADPAERSGYRPAAAAPSQPPVAITGIENEDAELAAAIEASLREARAPQPSAPVEGSGPGPTPPSRVAPPPIDLQAADTDALLSFAQASPHGPHGVHAVTPLYDRAAAARPNLVKAVTDASRRHQLLLEMSDKLTLAVKHYDRLLEQQVARSYGSTRPETVSTWAPQQANGYHRHAPASSNVRHDHSAYHPVPMSAPSLYPAVQDLHEHHETYVPPPASYASPPPAHPVTWESQPLSSHHPPDWQPPQPMERLQQAYASQAPAASVPPASPVPALTPRVYSLSSFPSVPASEPWAAASTTEPAKRVEAPLIEF